ncbi:MAG: hypothetical protein LBP75_04430, partial [Planctomycetota bacterium]|nr:hypothetical protein [Planctomycetota bacterium]
AAGGGVCRRKPRGGTVGLIYQSTATQGCGTVERVPYPGLIYSALSGRLSEFFQFLRCNSTDANRVT